MQATAISSYEQKLEHSKISPSFSHIYELETEYVFSNDEQSLKMLAMPC